MIVKHGACQSLQGLSGVRNVGAMRDILELRALFCGCVNSNGILCSQEHLLLNQRGSLCSFTPSELTGDLYVPCHLRRTFIPKLCFNLFYFFFLWPLDLFRMDHVNLI